MRALSDDRAGLPWNSGGHALPDTRLDHNALCPISKFWITEVTGGIPRFRRSFLNLYRVFLRSIVLCLVLTILIRAFDQHHIELTTCGAPDLGELGWVLRCHPIPVP